MTPAEDRFAMVSAALGDRPSLEASRIEIDRGGPSYTVDTVRQLLRTEPTAELFVVVGADVVGALDTWHDHESLARPGDPGRGRPARHSPRSSRRSGWRSVRVEVTPVDVSSTDLRTVLESGGSVEGLVPEAVIRCIAERGLYATGR